MRVLAFLLAPIVCVSALPAQEIIVRDPNAFRELLRNLKSGSVIKIAPGDYPGGHTITAVDDLTIQALDPKNPPVFRGGVNAIQFSRCNRLTVKYLNATEQTGNGFNIDDGGSGMPLVVDITLENLTVTNIGPQGNCDGIKCSGIDKAKIRDCTISGWGGQGIDFVGCHDCIISGCQLIGKDGFSATAGIQLKGGTSDILVEKCKFVNAGPRAIQLGGSTLADYFRPLSAKHEAARLAVRSCTIEGSECAAAFVGVDGAEFSDNTILFPNKWIFRILQETTTEGFAPCRNAVIKNNRILFRRRQVQTDINIGTNTAPETFRFDSNRWFAEDDPSASKPRLPVEETNGIYGQKLDLEKPSKS